MSMVFNALLAISLVLAAVNLVLSRTLLRLLRRHRAEVDEWEQLNRILRGLCYMGMQIRYGPMWPVMVEHIIDRAREEDEAEAAGRHKRGGP